MQVDGVVKVLPRTIAMSDPYEMYRPAGLAPNYSRSGRKEQIHSLSEVHGSHAEYDKGSIDIVF